MANTDTPIGICIAFGQNAFTTTPTWTRIDDPHVLAFGYNAGTGNTHNVKSWTTDRGRAYELDKTQTGTATIVIEDLTGLFDPTNPSGPFYGKITPMMRARINVQNPVNNGYYDIFTGFVESWNWSMEQNESIMHCTINLVDGFEPLTRGEIQVDSTGYAPYGGGPANTVRPIDRIGTLLDDAGWPTVTENPDHPQWRNLNTGNCYMQQTTYSPQTSFLSAIQDAADAEFPGVANFFMSKAGAATFYGRYPRFQPTNYPNDVAFWQVGDKGGADSQGAARIYDIQWNLDQKNLINACLCYDYGLDPTLLSTSAKGGPSTSAQFFVNLDSVKAYGVRSLSLPDLIIDRQPAGTGISSQPSLTGAQVCVVYAQYYVDNYKLPQLRISNLEFHARGVGDSQQWAFLTGVEIGDILTVFTSNPGGGGFGKQTDNEGLVSQFFVEGIHNVVNPNTQSVPDWVMTLDVSPRAWFPANYAIGG